MKKDKRLIPDGPYCYAPIGWSGGAMKIKPCPYHRIRQRKPRQLNGYCVYFKIADWRDGSELWDSVKSCGINVDPDD